MPCSRIRIYPKKKGSRRFFISSCQGDPSGHRDGLVEYVEMQVRRGDAKFVYDSNFGLEEDPLFDKIAEIAHTDQMFWVTLCLSLQSANLTQDIRERLNSIINPVLGKREPLRPGIQEDTTALTDILLCRVYEIPYELLAPKKKH